ncbi:DUF397 domain-containing protein [Actinophytocola sp.]|uniref:DUF397 domain-containing protein n=1 Tax=Actinophytocola sp. TaxID=1872138 RepID=UPI002EDB9540
MSADRLEHAVWRKSSASGAVGNCVELTWPQGEVVAVRNSRNPDGPVLVYSRTDLVTFLADVRKRRA